MSDEQPTVYLVLREHEPPRVDGCLHERKMHNSPEMIECKRPHFWREIIGCYASHEIAREVCELYGNDPHTMQVQAILVQEDEGYQGVTNRVERGWMIGGKGSR